MNDTVSSYFTGAGTTVNGVDIGDHLVGVKKRPQLGCEHRRWVGQIRTWGGSHLDSSTFEYFSFRPSKSETCAWQQPCRFDIFAVLAQNAVWHCDLCPDLDPHHWIYHLAWCDTFRLLFATKEWHAMRVLVTLIWWRVSSFSGSWSVRTTI